MVPARESPVSIILTYNGAILNLGRHRIRRNRLALQKIPLKGEASGRLVAGLLTVYFLMVFPAAHFFLRAVTPHYNYAFPLYLLAALIFLVAVRKTPLEQLALPWPPPKGHLALGAFLGALPVLALPLLDGLITSLGLYETELLKGASLRPGGVAAAQGTSLFAYFAGVLVIPVLKQGFFTGFVAQHLLKRYDPAVAIYLAGMIFSLAHFKLAFGLFVLGLACAMLLRVTGTLYTPILFHLGCALAAEWLVRDYPSLVTLLGFLF